MTYTPKFKPYKHQAEALDLLKDQESFALFMAMRCVDGDTEYLSPKGWAKISSYSGGQVAEFRLDGTAYFVNPKEYIKSPVDQFWYFKTQGGVDQVLSENHRILLCSRKKSTFGKYVGEVPDGFRDQPRDYTSHWRETSPRELIAHNRGYKDHIPTTFMLEGDTKLDLTDSQIRLMVAFHADGTYGKRDLTGITAQRKGYVRVKHEYKKVRMRLLLKDSGVDWSEKEVDGDYSLFGFRPPLISKTYGSDWWTCDKSQREVVCDEVCRWDGRTLHHRAGARKYSSIHECDADFIQFCFSSTGQRVSRSTKRQGDGAFVVHITGHGRTNSLALLPKPVKYDEGDGFMYSFSVPSTYLVLRRNGKIFVTGNTGKTKTIFDDYGRLEKEGKVQDLFVLAPGGVYKTWKSAFEEHASDDLVSRARIHMWESGSGVGRRYQRKAFLKAPSPRILLMNIEALSSVETARELAKEFLKRPSMLVADESTILKNNTAKRTKFVVKHLAPLSKYRRILSGLPTPRSPLDLYSQFEFLDSSILGFKMDTTI